MSDAPLIPGTYVWTWDQPGDIRKVLTSQFFLDLEANGLILQADVEGLFIEDKKNAVP